MYLGMFIGEEKTGLSTPVAKLTSWKFNWWKFSDKKLTFQLNNLQYFHCPFLSHYGLGPIKIRIYYLDKNCSILSQNVDFYFEVSTCAAVNFPVHHTD